jgi:nucleoside-diphosphate-sugar epimerase
MPKRGTLSIEKAKNLLNYSPLWPIEKGYTQYIDWYKNFFKDKFKF